MAIGRPFISASDVAKAFTQDNSGIGKAVQALGEQWEKRSLYEQKRREQQDLLSAKLADSNLSPLMKATGTPFDQYAQQRTGEILKGYNEFMRQNPNASYLQQQQYFLENTSALKSEIQNAEKLSKAISDYSAIIEKEYPTLDRTKVMEGLKKSAWYDEQGKLRTPSVDNINPFLASLDKDDVYRQYINPDALTDTMVKNMDKFFPESQRNIPIDGTPYYWDASLRPFEQLNTKTGERYIDRENIKIGDSEIPVLSSGVYNQLKTDRNFRIATLDRLEQLKERVPAVAKLDEDVQQRLAAGMVMNEIGVRGSKKAPVKRVSEEAKWKLQQQKEARVARHQSAMEGIARERLNISKQRAAGGGSGRQNVAQQFIGVLNNEPEAIKKAHSTTINPVIFDAMNIPRNLQPVEAYDLTKSVTGGLIDPNDGSGRKIKVFKDKNSDRIFVQKYIPLPADDKKDGINYAPSGWQEIPREQTINFVNSIASQLNKKTVDYPTELTEPAAQTSSDYSLPTVDDPDLESDIEAYLETYMNEY